MLNPIALFSGSGNSLAESGRSESRSTLRSPREDRTDVLQLRKVNRHPVLFISPSLALLTHLTPFLLRLSYYWSYSLFLFYLIAFKFKKYFPVVSLFPCFSSSVWSRVWRSLCLTIWERRCPMAQFSASWPITCDLVPCQSSTSPHRQWWANARILFSLWPKHNLVSQKNKCAVLIWRKLIPDLLVY